MTVFMSLLPWYQSTFRSACRRRAARHKHRPHLLMELLEDRLTPSTLGGLNFTVTDNSDNATDPNSLRYALTQIDANGNPTHEGNP